MQGICADGVDVAGVGGNDKVVRYLIGFDDIPLAGYCYVDGELRLAEGLQSEALLYLGVIYRDRDVFDRHGLLGRQHHRHHKPYHNGGEQRKHQQKSVVIEEIAYLQFFFLFHFFMPFIILLKVPSPVVNLLSELSMR